MKTAKTKHVSVVFKESATQKALSAFDGVLLPIESGGAAFVGFVRSPVVDGSAPKSTSVSFPDWNVRGSGRPPKTIAEYFFDYLFVALSGAFPRVQRGQTQRLSCCFSGVSESSFLRAKKKVAEKISRMECGVYADTGKRYVRAFLHDNSLIDGLSGVNATLIDGESSVIFATEGNGGAGSPRYIKFNYLK